jgi:Cu/Ag efflux pump CusA
MKKIINTLLHLVITLPLLAFLANMFLVAFLGRELAIELNNGTVALTTYLYTYLSLSAIFLLHTLLKRSELL